LDYLTIYKKDFSFALNDSGEESVSVYNPDKKLVDSMSYSTSKENYSWSFDGLKWRLSPYLTPGEINIFEKILKGKVKMDKNIYAHIYANFEAKADKDAQKFTWDFGDNHKSYLQKTRHKYEKSGEYEASLKITGHGEDNLYNFTVKVEDYSTPKVKIIGFVPNPKGKDSGEYLLLQNKSKEKVNLLNWSIATGWKNLYNHPIHDDFFLKKNESKKLTKKICAFTLNNTKTKIELRDPTGNVVQKIKYDRTKNKIVEDEIFELSGKNWQWNAPPNTEDNEDKPSNSSKNQPPTENSTRTETTNDAVIEEFNIVTSDEIKANAGKYTTNPTWQNKTQNRIILLSYNSHIKTPETILTSSGRILGVSTEKYSPPEKHWAVIFFDNILRKINYWLNWVLNRI
jgi:hypothetical protein